VGTPLIERNQRNSGAVHRLDVMFFLTNMHIHMHTDTLTHTGK